MSGLRALGFGVALVLAALGAAPRVASAPPVLPHFPVASRTSVDGATLYVETDDGAALGGLEVFVPAGTDHETASQNGVAALVAECVLRTPVDGIALRDAVSDAGGSVEYAIDGRATRYYLEGRAAQMPAITALLGRALGAPDFSAVTVNAARVAVSARAGDTDASALSTAIQMFRHAYYATGAGLPALGTPTPLAGLDQEELSRFYAATYRRGGLVASAAGEGGPALADALRALVAALPAGSVVPVVPKANSISEKTPRIVARRDVGAPYVVVGFAAPNPGAADFGSMLILESLLSRAFERTSATSLGLRERSVGAMYLFDGAPASLVVYVNGTLADPSTALREVIVVARSLAAQPLGAATLRRFKTAAEGSFVTDAVSLSDRAYELGAFGSMGPGADPLNATLAAVERASASDVQRAAKRYLQRYIVALVLPRETPSGG